MGGVVFVEGMKPVKPGTLAFVPAYNQWLEEELRKTPPRDRDGFISPSSVGGCPTAAIHQLNGEEKVRMLDADLAWEDLANVGTMIHRYYQARGESMGILTDCEKFVEIPGWKVRGQIDGVIKRRKPTDKRRVERFLFEIKTVGSFDFKKVCGTSTPLPKHLAQNVVYMSATGLDSTRFLYVERDFVRLKEVVQDFDPEIYASVERWIERVLGHHDAGTYPGPKGVWDPKGTVCGRCHYFHLCNSKIYNKSGIHLLEDA